MHRVEEVSATIEMAEYCRLYRNADYFITLCQKCNEFGKRWSCPPFENEIDINQYKYAHIFGTKIWVNSSLRENPPLTKEQLQAATIEIIAPIREALDERVLQLEQKRKNSRALFAGSCKGCPQGECTRIKGAACIKPNLMRPSLEALGFDVGKSCSELLGIELQWSSENLPLYFTLVYALFSEEPLT